MDLNFCLKIFSPVYFTSSVTSTAEDDGVVKSVSVTQGQTVEREQILVEVE